MMKKKWTSLLLALVLSVSLLPLPARAAYSDVTDSYLSSAVEALRLMGVMGGYGDGTFRPNAVLTRAQFCKMAVYAMDGGSRLGLYRGITIFPDVKPSHWASAYINMAARTRIGDSEKGQTVITGYADGRFYPDRSVTAGQAVTILLRILGYTNADMSGVWPTSQMALGASVGLTEGINLPNGNAPLTRAQAAELFVNLLRCEKKGGGTLYTLSDKTTLVSVDGSGSMKTADKTYTMARTQTATALAGRQGRVVTNAEGKALTFLPLGGGNTGISAAAVVIYKDGSSAGLSSLTGGGSYKLYKNGIAASAQDLRKNDVAVSPDGKSVQVCDTRVTVYYESCTPSSTAPATVEVLGGTELNVLPTAQESLSKFRPGDTVTLLLTADGQVAAAAKPGDVSGNAMAAVSDDGTVRLLCGDTELKLKSKAEDHRYFGEVLQISSVRKNQVDFYRLSNTSGTLNVTARTLGDKKLADNVLLYREGQRIALSQLEADTVSGDGILYARTNWAGRVDLIVLGDKNGTVCFGRAEFSEHLLEDGTSEWYLRVDYQSGKTGAFVDPLGRVRTGDFVRVVYTGKYTTTVSVLQQFKDVPFSAWSGEAAVTAGGHTYAVPDDVLCYNSDLSKWVTRAEARAYAERCTLHIYDGAVRAIEVGGK